MLLTTGLASSDKKSLHTQPVYAFTRRVEANDSYLPRSGTCRVSAEGICGRFKLTRSDLMIAGLFLLSLATLLLEISLTRVLSVSLWYHFGSLVISTALLGFGASGVTLALWIGLRETKNLDLGLGIGALVFAVCVVLSFWLMQRIPFDPFSVAVDHRHFSSCRFISFWWRSRFSMDSSP